MLSLLGLLALLPEIEYLVAFQVKEGGPGERLVLGLLLLLGVIFELAPLHQHELGLANQPVLFGRQVF
jgi:hypothetical protein